MTRIRLDLSDYDFDIVYKKGRSNTNADALSRIKLDSSTLKEMIPKYKDEKETILAVIRNKANKKRHHK